MFMGWSLARSGEVAEGRRRLKEGLAVWARLGARSYLPRALCLSAETLLVQGRYAEGLEEVARALAIADETGERWYVSRIHRVRAELHLHSRDRSDEAVEASLRTAVDIARSQGAAAWELQAVTLLAQLMADRGERMSAYDLLAPLWARLASGPDTPDLREAAAVLAMLN
jgi:predicted ATPase